jgi:hypothetical protein
LVAGRGQGAAVHDDGRRTRSPLTAARIASDLGIIEAKAPMRTGLELDQLDEQGWRDTVRDTSVYAVCFPRSSVPTSAWRWVPPVPR